MIRTRKKEFNKLAFFLIPIAIIILIVLFSIVYWNSPGGIKENIQLKQRISVLDKDIEQLSIENNALQKEILRMKSSPDYLIEKIAREDLKLKKENEKIVYFEKSDDTEDSKR
ncbi:septum formation initiator family protein [bacterium]|nr:septum formation initiator family protein [bacterium]MCK5600173.1 septum formation initiator family protein [bacterium]